MYPTGLCPDGPELPRFNTFSTFPSGVWHPFVSTRYLSKYYLPTRKENPQEADIVSHRLMIRAGMIRQLSQGLYSYLPFAKRVLRKIKRIVREEMNRAGAQELEMPILQPKELWDQTGRWEDYGPEMMRLEDRHDREYGLGPTHEEVITDLVRNELTSYRDLPVNFYQIATKFRDEVRPRFGVMRSREFIMKDAYSFHVDEDSARETYRVMDETYQSIFDRIGFQYRKVEAATGAIGGSLSHEFMVLADSGEDTVLFSEKTGYAANQEQAEGVSPEPDYEPRDNPDVEAFETPGVQSIEDLMDVDSRAVPERQIKTLVYRIDGVPTAVLLPGNYELNELKLDSHADGTIEEMTAAEIREYFGATPGSLGAVNLDSDEVRVWADSSLKGREDMYTGANREEYHLGGVCVDRDIEVDRWVSLRLVKEGDLDPDEKGELKSQSGIEVGHIFYLGTKYSEALDATVKNDSGDETPMIMGCYGIGISRIMAAAIEQSHDEQGIIWPESIAPFDVYILVIGWDNSDRREAAETLARQLDDIGVDVLVDDRSDVSAGVKFNESELIGVPHRLTIGQSLQEGTVEYQRRGGDDSRDVPLENVVDFLEETMHQ
jgi:prolyl-tRNA synthetase